MTVFIGVSAAALILAAYQLNPLCFYLSPLVIGVLFFYSLTKRFTWASHLVLGLSLGGAPLGAWIAVAGTFDLPPIVLGAAVLCWVAGFDILYACQDYEFDRGAGLHSIPVRFGLVGALNFARAFHLAALCALCWVGLLMELRVIYWVGIGIVALLLLWEHRLVKPDDLTKVNMAFMTMNSLVSVVFFGFTVADLLLLGGDFMLWSQ